MKGQAQVVLVYPHGGEKKKQFSNLVFASRAVSYQPSPHRHLHQFWLKSKPPPRREPGGQPASFVRLQTRYRKLQKGIQEGDEDRRSTGNCFEHFAFMY